MKKTFLLFILMFITHFLNGQSNINFNGFWRYDDSGYEEHLGHYEYRETLLIDGDNYTWLQERTSEFAMFWEYGERGAILITDNKFHFFPKKIKGQTYDWRSIENNKLVIKVYKYAVDGKYLTLTRENETTVFIKTAAIMK
jgi:hypothetical protein